MHGSDHTCARRCSFYVVNLVAVSSGAVSFGAVSFGAVSLGAVNSGTGSFGAVRAPDHQAI